MKIKIKMILVDDHSLFRIGLVHLFNSQPDFQVVGEASTIEDAISLVETKHPDLVLMDLGLPDGSGVASVSKILQIDPNTNIVLLTIHESVDFALTAIELGAKGFLLKNISASALLTSLRALEKGELAVSRTIMSRFINDFKPFLARYRGQETSKVDVTLTRREIDILIALGEGDSNMAIAKRYMISENTVKVHVHNILRKLKLQNRHEAANYAERVGLVYKN